MTADEIQGKLREQVMCVLFPPIVFVLLNPLFPLIMPEIIGEIEDRVILVQITIPRVESLAVRHAGRTGFAKTPLPGDASRVASSPQQFRNCDVFLQQWNAVAYPTLPSTSAKSLSE